jgi:sortase A
MTKGDSNGTKPKRYWSWLVVLIAILVVIGGGMGGLVVSNLVATSRYADTTGDIGTLSIPRLGTDYSVPIVSGTSLADLRQGVGWYESTASPGQIGNFALTGYRLGWGQPFAQLGTLQAGDQIVVRTNDGTFTYTVITGPTIVSDKETDILAPVPGGPDRTPTKALITLTTAASILPSPDRLIVIGELVTA